jgi:hypothetical protein
MSLLYTDESNTQKTFKTLDATVGDPADAAVTDETSSGTAIAILKKILYFLRIGGLETASVLGASVSAQIVNTTATVVAAAQTSKKIAVSGVVLSNTSAVATEVEIQDGSGGTILAVLYVPANSQSGANFPTARYTTSGNGVYAKCRTTASAVTVTVSGWAE